MDAIWDGLVEAIRMIARGDAEIREVAFRTVMVSGLATVFAMLCGVPIGYWLARGRFYGRTFLLAAVNTGMGMPPVVIGLVVWLLLIRSGPFGEFELIYTKQAMIVAQFLIALPLVIGFSAAAIQALPEELPDLLRVLGAGKIRRIWLLSREAHLGLLAAVMAGLGAAISEVGASMQVGGNLAGSTRVLTTAVVLETSKGQTGKAIALGLILLAMAFLANLVLTVVQQHRWR